MRLEISCEVVSMYIHQRVVSHGHPIPMRVFLSSILPPLELCIRDQIFSALLYMFLVN